VLAERTAATISPTHEAAERLVWIHGADELTFFRLHRLLSSVGLRTKRVLSGETDDGAETPAVALVIAAGAAQWKTVAALCRRFDTVVLAPEPSVGGEDRALELGAIGYLPLHFSDITLSKTLSSILAGETGFSRVVLGRWLRGQSARIVRVDTPELTARQDQILELIARGHADKQIARQLGIATATVHKHVQLLLRRLRVPNRAAAVRYGRTRRIDEPV